jgi:hypothetical protein
MVFTKNDKGVSGVPVKKGKHDKRSNARPTHIWRLYIKASKQLS